MPVRWTEISPAQSSSSGPADSYCQEGVPTGWLQLDPTAPDLLSWLSPWFSSSPKANISAAFTTEIAWDALKKGLAFVHFSWAFDGKTFTKPSCLTYIFGLQGNYTQNAKILCSRPWRMPLPPDCFSLSCCGWDEMDPLKDFHPHSTIPVYVVMSFLSIC